MSVWVGSGCTKYLPDVSFSLRTLMKVLTTPEPSQEWSYNLEFASMGDFADAVDWAYADTPRPT